MPNIKISQLPSANTLIGTEAVPIVQSSTTRRTTTSAIANLALGTLTVINKGTVSSGTVTFTQSEGAKQKLTVGGAITIAYAGWPASGIYADLEIELVNGGSASITWPSVNWMNGDGTSSTTFTNM